MNPLPNEQKLLKNNFYKLKKLIKKLHKNIYIYNKYPCNNMGLDWILLDKPAIGKESLYTELKDKYKQIELQIIKNEAEELEQSNSLDKINKLLEEIVISPYETISCPKTSDSEETKKYFLDLIYPYLKKEGKTFEEIYESNKNNYIVELSPCFNDLPTGTACVLASKLDFRGQIIGRSDLIDDDLREEAYEPHSPIEMLDYANRLEICIKSFDKSQIDEESELEDISDSIKWLRFWGTKSHGFGVWF